jgi:hypothetical protein
LADYTDLNSTLEEQLARTARFVRAAFHVHSIDSHDWAGGLAGLAHLVRLCAVGTVLGCADR